MSPTVRPLRLDDMPDVCRIDALHTDTEEKAAYWERIAGDFLAGRGDRQRIALAAEDDGVFTGFLFGEVRAFEFGSDACGWIFAVGVDPTRERGGAATALLDEACALFKAAGVDQVRTMVRRNDVPLLSFFRSNSFVGGSFVQLECNVAARVPARPAEEHAA